MTCAVVVAGVGMIPFVKPGASGTYVDMGAEAARLALADARIDYAQVQQYQQRYGARDATFAKVRAKASRPARHDERAIFRKEVTVEEVLASPAVFLGLTRLQCCPPTCGAAAAVVCSERFAARHGLPSDVRIRAQAMTTDRPSSFDGSLMRAVGADMAREAATMVYGGRVVTNPSGGLLAKGHPLGATGLAQCFELVTQLRGAAGARQVEGARLALQHNVGLGGACVVTLYERT